MARPALIALIMIPAFCSGLKAANLATVEPLTTTVKHHVQQEYYRNDTKSQLDNGYKPTRRRVRSGYTGVTSNLRVTEATRIPPTLPEIRAAEQMHQNFYYNSANMVNGKGGKQGRSDEPLNGQGAIPYFHPESGSQSVFQPFDSSIHQFSVSNSAVPSVEYGQDLNSHFAPPSEDIRVDTQQQIHYDASAKMPRAQPGFPTLSQDSVMPDGQSKDYPEQAGQGYSDQAPPQQGYAYPINSSPSSGYANSPAPQLAYGYPKSPASGYPDSVAAHPSGYASPPTPQNDYASTPSPSYGYPNPPTPGGYSDASSPASQGGYGYPTYSQPADYGYGKGQDDLPSITGSGGAQLNGGPVGPDGLVGPGGFPLPMQGPPLPPQPPQLIKGSIDYILIPLILIGISAPIFVVVYVVLGSIEAKLAPVFTRRSLSDAASSLASAWPASENLISSVSRALTNGGCWESSACSFGVICREQKLLSSSWFNTKMDMFVPQSYRRGYRAFVSGITSPNPDCSAFHCSN